MEVSSLVLLTALSLGSSLVLPLPYRWGSWLYLPTKKTSPDITNLQGCGGMGVLQGLKIRVLPRGNLAASTLPNPPREPIHRADVASRRVISLKATENHPCPLTTV